MGIKKIPGVSTETCRPSGSLPLDKALEEMFKGDKLTSIIREGGITSANKQTKFINKLLELLRVQGYKLSEKGIEVLKGILQRSHMWTEESSHVIMRLFAKNLVSHVVEIGEKAVAAGTGAAKGVLKTATAAVFGSAGKTVLKGGAKLLGAVALPIGIASTMFDAAEASSGASKAEIQYPHLRKAYQEQDVPERDRLTFDQFASLTEEKRKALLYKYGVKLPEGR